MIVVRIVHNIHPSREFNDDLISIRRMLYNLLLVDGMEEIKNDQTLIKGYHHHHHRIFFQKLKAIGYQIKYILYHQLDAAATEFNIIIAISSVVLI